MRDAWAGQDSAEMTRLLPSGRTVLLLDVIAVLWICAWIVLGLRVAEEVEGLARLSDTVVATGEGIQEVGNVLGALSSVPIVGGELEGATSQVREAGESAVRSGRQTRDSAQTLSTLLGVSVALIPSSALILFYFPARVARERERHALRRLLREARDDPQLDRLLAHRALMTMSYRQLIAMGGRPWAELAAGHGERLAAEEAAEVGVERVEAQRAAGRAH